MLIFCIYVCWGYLMDRFREFEFWLLVECFWVKNYDIIVCWEWLKEKEKEWEIGKVYD